MTPREPITRRWLGTIVAVAAGLSLAATVAPRALTIYFIDVEGGQATLLVAADKHSLLIDAGYPDLNDRDPERIMAAVADAGLSRIDALLVTHFHEDHDGGVPGLARRIPIDRFIDYGEPVQVAPEVGASFAAYTAVRQKGEHLVPAAGAPLPVPGFDAHVVSAGGALIAKPIDGPGERNQACDTYVPSDDDPSENPRSLGIVLRFGRFRFIDLGDLSWNPLGRLVCPANLLGPIDLYLVPHHGAGDTSIPALLAAVDPRVAILNNGPYKGGSPRALTLLHKTRGRLEDVWQLHRVMNDGVDNFPDSVTANLDEGRTAYWLKAVALEDGTFTVTNGRTGETRRYPTEVRPEPPRHSQATSR